MPIYEYLCLACGHEFELLQKTSDAPEKKCPACGKNKAQKQISAAGFKLKGTGWYETDFKDKPQKKPTEKPSKQSTKKTKDPS